MQQAPETMAAEIARLVALHLGRRGPLLPLLHDVQATFGCIPDEALPAIAQGLNLSRAEVHGVITFYHDYRRTSATQANVVTTEFSDWATNCPEYKVTAVQVAPSNRRSSWQERYETLSLATRRIEATPT